MKELFILLSLSVILLACNNSSETDNSESTNGEANTESSSNRLEEALSVDTEGGTLHGNLVLPAAEGNFPIAIIIAGSGPTDRNGNGPIGLNSDAYKMLADSLAACGIASLRYDKRLIGESTSPNWVEKNLRFEQMVDDVGAWMALLKQDGRFTEMHLIGHSEGSLVGMLAAKEYEVASFTSIAGPGRAAHEMIYIQLLAQNEELANIAKPKLDSMAEGFTVSIGNPNLLSLLRSTVQPYLISWFAYNPSEEIAKLDIPVYLVQGETDIQVSAEEFELLKAAKPDALTKLVPGMNHVLKDAPAERMQNMATYSNPGLPLSGGWIQGLCEMILG